MLGRAEILAIDSRVRTSLLRRSRVNLPKEDFEDLSCSHMECLTALDCEQDLTEALQEQVDDLQEKAKEQKEEIGELISIVQEKNAEIARLANVAAGPCRFSGPCRMECDQATELDPSKTNYLVTGEGPEAVREILCRLARTLGQKHPDLTGAACGVIIAERKGGKSVEMPFDFSPVVSGLSDAEAHDIRRTLCEWSN